MSYAYKRKLTLFPIRSLLGLFVAVATLGCGDDDSEKKPECYLGDEQSCSMDSGCTGTQTCFADGWSDCSCGADNLDTVGIAGAGNDPTTIAPAKLGTPCAINSECPTGAFCLLPTTTEWFGGGPPEGLCVADCSTDPSRCSAFEASTCVSSTLASSAATSKAFCLPTCALDAGTQASPACAAVPSSACDALPGQTLGFCRPFCMFDVECASGVCDRRYGTCVTTAAPPASVGFGERCDPVVGDCAGVCVTLSSGNHVCSARCLAGDATECVTDQAVSRRSSLCGYANSSTVRPGNLGYCAPLCDCNVDCTATGFVCKPFSLTETRDRLGRAGMCSPTPDSDGKVELGIPCQ